MEETNRKQCAPEGQPRVRVPLKIEEALAGLAIGILAVITFANVVVRYFTSLSFAFTEEFSISLMVIMSLLGGAAAVAKRGHLNIGYFLRYLAPGPLRWVEVAGAAMVAITFLVMAYLGAQMTWDDYRYEVTSPGLGYPQWIYTIWLPLLCLAISGRALGLMIRLWKGGRG